MARAATEMLRARLMDAALSGAVRVDDCACFTLQQRFSVAPRSIGRKGLCEKHIGSRGLVMESAGWKDKNPAVNSISKHPEDTIGKRTRVQALGASGNGVVASEAEQAISTGRVATVARKTKETDVEVTIGLDGTGVCSADTGIPFLDHMIDQLASHGLFDIAIRARGDTHIDDHHTNEDIALALGTALSKALGDRKGINRFGDFSAPLDEALIHVVLDLSGRPHLSYDLVIPTARVGTYDTQLVEHFFQSLANNSGMTLHIRQLAGKNSHHIIEATFKAFARALRRATEEDLRRSGTVPSSKGVLTQS